MNGIQVDDKDSKTTPLTCNYVDNFEHISHVLLVVLFLTCTWLCFWHVLVCWDVKTYQNWNCFFFVLVVKTHISSAKRNIILYN